MASDIRMKAGPAPPTIITSIHSPDAQIKEFCSIKSPLSPLAAQIKGFCSIFS